MVSISSFVKWRRRAGLLFRLLILGILSLSATQCSPAQNTNDKNATGQNDKNMYSNRLINSSDPYLLLHAHNPVDWYPWGPEALETARREDKPIFVSIGYSTCYWCHVAEREIYSNPEIASLMNDWFVNIKIDREERPDLDSIYMMATQIMTGHGGWPNNVFLTSDLVPFFAGSYFPPAEQGGRPGFPQILTQLHDAWINDRDKVQAVAERMLSTLQEAGQASAGKTSTREAVTTAELAGWMAQAESESMEGFDPVNGGFGNGGTKFPRSPQLAMLLAAASSDTNKGGALSIVTKTLDALAEGGVMDQLGGGFHRYSTEPTWSVPHFEKMLYDNAQLLGIYARAFEITEEPLFRLVALRTARYLTTEMRDPDGGFYSAQDAEVDGVEGESYVWTTEEIASVLGKDDAGRFFGLYALTAMPEAPFGHEQVPGGVLRLKPDASRALTDERALAAEIEKLTPQREKLLKVRAMREQPQRDDKIVIADNALAIMGFTFAGNSLGEKSLTTTAVLTANWIWQQAFDEQSGELKHQFFHGQAAGHGFLDDYALLGEAYMGLYVTTNETQWLNRARAITDAMLTRFARPDGTLTTSWDDTDLLVAPPSDGDSVKPSGQSAAISLLLKMASADLGAPGTQGAQGTKYALAARRALSLIQATANSRPSGWGTLVASVSQPAHIKSLAEASEVSAPAKPGKLSESIDYVHAKGHWVSTSDGLDLMLTVRVDPGFHINANPASSSYLIPTKVVIDGFQDAEVEYPAPKVFQADFQKEALSVYEGRVYIRAHLSHPPETSETVAPTVSLRVQACNEEVCMAPSTLMISTTGPGQKESLN